MTNDQRPMTNESAQQHALHEQSSVVGRRSSASAPGKIILCGEHAVVYGRPAIALPLHSVRAYANIEPARTTDGWSFSAPDFGRTWLLDAKPDDPLSQFTTEVLAALGVKHIPALHATITSEIPIASGLGSGAAVATALVRALANYYGETLSNDQISALVYENERRLHGTPSGIDNTVVAFERPIWFERGQTVDGGGRTVDSSPTVHRPLSTVQFISIASPFALLIADTGVRSPTKLPVGDVRRHWQADSAYYEALFDRVGEIIHAIRDALASGNVRSIGPLLDQNHALLQQIGVSSPELDRLVQAAKDAGALGAKLSGAGWGGVMLALVTEETRERVANALRLAGATQVLATVVEATEE